MTVTEKEFRFMVNSLTTQLIQMISEEEGIGYLEAADILYNSELYQKLEQPATGLYFQSPGYVYSFMKCTD